MMGEEAAILIRELEEAFGYLPVPPEDGVFYDNSGCLFECNEIRAHFHGRHWRELSVDDILEEPEALAFFTMEGFRFYLPAFIRACLLEPERVDLIPDNILSSFAVPGVSAW